MDFTMSHMDKNTARTNWWMRFANSWEVWGLSFEQNKWRQ